MKDIGKKLMDIARWYSMPADHFNTIKEAVEMLEQKSKKPSYNSVKTELDLISRQTVLEKAYKIVGYDRNAYVVDVADIEALPSVSTEKTGRWIPVSERLPEDGTYLVCTDDGYIATIMYDCSMGWLLDANIVAYMPLPQPYKGESEDSE